MKEIKGLAVQPSYSVMSGTDSLVKPSTCHGSEWKHVGQPCCFREATCHNCGKVGRIAPVCRAKTVSPVTLKKQFPHKLGLRKTKYVFTEAAKPEGLGLFGFSRAGSPLIQVELLINGESVMM